MPDIRQISARACRTNVLQRPHEAAWRNTSGNGFSSRRIDRSENLPGGSYEQPKNAENALNAPYNFSTHRRAYNKEEEEENDNDENANASEELSTDSDPLQPLPTFPEADWPKILMLILSYATSPTQRDILLLGALTALGATMERYVRCSYSGKYQSPCLQTFFVAPPASGKSGLSLIRLLVEPIHDKIRQQVDEEMKAYRKEKKNYELLGKERVNTEAPQMPPNKMFLISGNNSGTGILQNIMDANGTGLICETEADTIASAISSEYGHWSDTLRKAFDHDRLSYNRRTDQEYREVKRIFLAVLLSGTPAQVRALIPSAENGLFSRQLFYYMHGIYTWADQFACGEIDLDEIFRSIGRDWQLKLDILKEHGIHTLRLTDEQKKEFNGSLLRFVFPFGHCQWQRNEKFHSPSGCQYLPHHVNDSHVAGVGNPPTLSA